GRRRVAPAGRIELEPRARVDDAVVGDAVGDADEVAEVGLARLRAAQQRREVGDVALDVPGGREAGTRLGGGAVVDIGVSQIEGRGAVELPSRGDGEVGGEHHLRPGAWTVCGRRVAEGLGREVGELQAVKQRHDAGLAV